LLTRHRKLKSCGTKKIIDDLALQFYYRLNTGKEVIQNFYEF